MEVSLASGESFSAISKQSGFNFSLYKGRVDWKKIGNLDVDRLINEKDLELLSQLLRNVTNLNLESDFDVKVLDPDFVKLFRLAQLSVDFLLHCKSYLEKCLSDSHSKLNVAVQEVNLLRRLCEERKIELRKLKRRLKEQTASQIHQSSYKCYLCGKAFIEETYLLSHHSRRHSDNSYYACAETSSPPTTAMLRTEIKQLKERLNTAEMQLNKRCLAAAAADEEGSSSPQLENGEVRDGASNLRDDVTALRNLLLSEIKKLKEDGKHSQVHSPPNENVSAGKSGKTTAEVSTNTHAQNEQETLAELLARILSTSNRGGGGDSELDSIISRTSKETSDKPVQNFSHEVTNKTTKSDESITGTRSAITKQYSTVTESPTIQKIGSESGERGKTVGQKMLRTSREVTFDKITVVSPRVDSSIGKVDSVSNSQNISGSVLEVGNQGKIEGVSENVLGSSSTAVGTKSVLESGRNLVATCGGDSSDSSAKVVESCEVGTEDSSLSARLDPPQPKPRSKAGKVAPGVSSRVKVTVGAEVGVVATHFGTSDVTKNGSELELRSISSQEDCNIVNFEKETRENVSIKRLPLQRRGLFAQKSIWNEELLVEEDTKFDESSKTVDRHVPGTRKPPPEIVVTQFSSDRSSSQELAENSQPVTKFPTERSSTLNASQESGKTTQIVTRFSCTSQNSSQELGKTSQVVTEQFSSDRSSRASSRERNVRPVFAANTEINEFLEEISSDLDDSGKFSRLEKIYVFDKSGGLGTSGRPSSGFGTSAKNNVFREGEEEDKNLQEDEKLEVKPVETDVVETIVEDERRTNQFEHKLEIIPPTVEAIEKERVVEHRNERIREDRFDEQETGLSDLADSALIADPDSDQVSVNVQMLLAANPDILRVLRSDLEAMLGRRLRELGVDPEWTRLPDRSYQDKNAALQHHKAIVAKRYHNYFKLHRQLEDDLQHCCLEKMSLINDDLPADFHQPPVTSTPRSTSDGSSSQLRMTVSDDDESADSQSADTSDEEEGEEENCGKQSTNPKWPSLLKSNRSDAIGQQRSKRKRVVFLDELSSGRSSPRVIGVRSVVVASSANHSP